MRDHPAVRTVGIRLFLTHRLKTTSMALWSNSLLPDDSVVSGKAQNGQADSILCKKNMKMQVQRSVEKSRIA